MDAKSSSIILGISYMSHDSGACIIVDGNVIAMSEEERFSRIKHDNSFPFYSIQSVLKVSGIKPEDIDIVAIPLKWNHSLLRRTCYGIKNFQKSKIFLFKNVFGELVNNIKFDQKIIDVFNFSGLKLSSKCKIFTYEHHLSHAACAYLSSGFDKSIIISWDGRGEWPCIVYAIGEGTKLTIIDRCYFPNSIGQVYQAITQYLGFADIGDEYKVMGLSSYGSPEFLNVFRKMIFNKKWKVIVNQNYLNYHIYDRFMSDRYSMNIEKELGPARDKGSPINERYQNVAASIQERVNELGVAVATALRSKFNIDNLCLTGGVAQNIIMNQRIYENTEFKNVFVAPASTDSGLSLGSALLAAYENGSMNERFVINSSAWGESFDSHYVKRELANYNLSYIKPKELLKTCAKLLDSGEVIGWFQGRAEFGPRALGNRCILADPRRAEMKDIVNEKIKFREEFRPFAPSVLEENFYDFFTECPINYYMTFMARLADGKGQLIPAVTHVNNTARPQAVSKKYNFKYWSLIKEFEKISNIPVILNTSFNVKGEPIVNSPSDAIRCFFSTGLDFLAIEDFIVYKDNYSILERFL